MINYAHKGASASAPENTISAFYLGLIQGANGFETDICRAKDGELVLFHDSTLDRLTDGKGNLLDYTTAELKQLKVRGNAASRFYDRIPTYREFLENFAKYDIQFAIELSVKDPDLARDTLALSQEFGIMEKATFTSFHFENLEKTKALCPEAKVGWLVHFAGEEEVQKLLSIGGEDICPRAQNITEESMALWRSAGLGVRAWGVTNVSMMKKMYAFGIDGMTVDFPEQLCAYHLIQMGY